MQIYCEMKRNFMFSSQQFKGVKCFMTNNRNNRNVKTYAIQHFI